MGVLDEWESEVRAMSEAEGEAKGEVIGIAIGEARGKAIGVSIGIAIQSENIAQNLVKLGTIAPYEIAKACGLPLKRVQELAAGK